MLLKWLTNHSLTWNVILRDRHRFHNFTNGLFKTMDILNEKDNIIELVEKEFENPAVKREDIQSNKKKVFISLMTKLFHYSKTAPISSKLDDFIRSMSHPNSESTLQRPIYNDLLTFFREKNDFDGIVMVEKMYSYDKNLENLESLSFALNAWKNGKIKSSFDIFSELYESAGSQLRCEILRTLQGLIFYSIAKKGKAVVNDVIKCTIYFSRDKNESSLLVCVWYSLFTSDMYDDRCQADDLLNENSHLQSGLNKYIPWIGFLFLQNNQVTNYQRLIETALRFNMNDSVGLLLRNLFNYYYYSGYTSGCSAVYKCCTHLNVKLTYDQLHKYQILVSSDSRTRIKKLKITSPEEFKFKF